ncbi:MAG: HD-GYP domain-containing protein [Deltaproteobacteria bacterium]|nr:HD-GYP domain-containing protein [Deltaproteobacteria bacterium]
MAENANKKISFAEQVAENPFQPIELEFITIDTVLDHDLYLKSDNKYVLYRKASLPFTMKDKHRLQDSRTKVLFIRCESERELRRFYESNLPNIIDSPKVTVKQKAEVLYQCATGIAQDIFENPSSKESIGKSREVVNNTIKLLGKSSDSFLQIISLSSHDYYTYTHCVNVMTFSIGLLSSLGIKDPVLLKEVGAGALLHDIGKAKVPIHILNKPGPLTDEEWVVMKQHPVFGYEMLHSTPTPERGKEIVIQHHEKISGIGYPKGLKGDAVPLASQVVSICDAYDAMTTNRCYQKALKPFQAFQIITHEMRGHFDPKIVEKFIQMLNLKKKA